MVQLRWEHVSTMNNLICSLPLLMHNNWLSNWIAVCFDFFFIMSHQQGKKKLAKANFHLHERFNQFNCLQVNQFSCRSCTSNTSLSVNLNASLDFRSESGIFILILHLPLLCVNWTLFLHILRHLMGQNSISSAFFFLGKFKTFCLILKKNVYPK